MKLLPSKVEEAIGGKSENELWLALRNGRLAGSMFVIDGNPKIPEGT